MGRQVFSVLAVFLTVAFALGCSKNVLKSPGGNNNAQPNSPNHPHTLFFGPSHPPAQTGVQGDFFLDVYDSLLYGPKSTAGWGIPLQLPVEAGAGQIQMLTGSGVPPSGLGNIGDFYLDLQNADLFGPKVIAGWVNTISLGGSGNGSGPSSTGPAI